MEPLDDFNEKPDPAQAVLWNCAFVLCIILTFYSIFIGYFFYFNFLAIAAALILSILGYNRDIKNKRYEILILINGMTALCTAIYYFFLL